MSKRVIGYTITTHYDDTSTSTMKMSVEAAAALLSVTGRSGGSKYTYINADECPVHGPWRAVPGGTTKDGRDYGPFWGCDQEKGEPRCTNKPHKDWVETHPPERALPRRDDGAAFDDLPF
jgi:hypothetical protein